MNLLEEIVFLLEETAICWLPNIFILIWLIKLKRNYIPVIGTCVGREYVLRSEALTFVYEYEGKSYKSKKSVPNLPFKAQISKQYKIYVLKWNPYEFKIIRDVRLLIVYFISSIIEMFIIVFFHFI